MEAGATAILDETREEPSKKVGAVTLLDSSISSVYTHHSMSNLVTAEPRPQRTLIAAGEAHRRKASRETTMTAQIIWLAEYRKAKEAKEAEEVRRVVNEYFAEHSLMMSWWPTAAPVG